MNLTINNVTIELNQDTVTQLKKAIEEFEKSDEIQERDEYFHTENCDGLFYQKTWFGTSQDKYRQSQDNCLPCKNYTEEQAKEYFDKRDARRAAETKLRKIISDMNKKDGFVAKFGGKQENWFSCFSKNLLTIDWFMDQQALELWRYSSKETAQFINENHADLLKAYLNG